MGGMFANASSLLSFTHSDPENNSEITSFEDIRVFFNMAEVTEGEGSEGEWGIGYFGSYNAKPKRHRGAILYKGDADSGELLSQIDGSIYGNSEEFVAGRDYISLSFPGIEVESGQTYTIVITYEVFVTKVSGGELGTNALKDDPVTLTFTGADNVKKALSVESCSLSDSDNFERIEDIYLQFNHNIGIKDNIDACIIEDNNILVSCISCNQSENNLTLKFPETKLYKGHNYHLVIPAESIYIEDNPDIYNTEINIPFEGASYNLFGYSRVIPRPGVATLLDEIQIIFDFPAGYGFVYVDNDATYPLTVYKGEAVEANLLGTVKDDGVTSDSKGAYLSSRF